MDYKNLPPVRRDKSLKLNHFPNNYYAAVFRLWETVPAEKMAIVFNTTEDEIVNTAQSMGLPRQNCNPDWKKRGYITTVRNAWHILPYEQLLDLMDWSEDEFATILKEDDFLDIKLGNFKPFCHKIEPSEPDEEGRKKLELIKKISEKHFDNLFLGAEPFKFFDDTALVEDEFSDKLRMIYSYCGLYAGVLDNDIDLSYPETLLKMYKASGINAIWLPAVLYQLVEFPFDSKYSIGWQERQQRLRELIAKADKYGIKVLLYLNEPRCMPLDFFKNHPELEGKNKDMYGALCTTKPEVMDYLRYAVRTLCSSVEGIGGFFTITCSENLTHCKSRMGGSECIRCKDVPVYKLVSDIICAISEESRKVSPQIKTIAWTWAWADYMSEDDIKKCIDLLPREVIIQSNSEDGFTFNIGGVDGIVRDYRISIPGPANHAKTIWNYAKSLGHEVCAKVQVNNSWECSTIPYLPVFDLVREHMTGLRNQGIDHIMLSWTLGGYPSVSLKLADMTLKDSSEEAYDDFLKEHYGEYASSVKKSARLFSKAFREFPFHILSLYHGPQNPGPSNLLYLEPTGFEATMTCYCYDDLDCWRSIYPRDVYINQFKKLSETWREGLRKIENMPECEFKQVAWAGYAIFRSSYLQAEFINHREKGDIDYLLELITEEKEIALILYDLMHKNSLIGYEAANHYYYNRGMLLEKVISCEHIIYELTKLK